MTNDTPMRPELCAVITYACEHAQIESVLGQVQHGQRRGLCSRCADESIYAHPADGASI